MFVTPEAMRRGHQSTAVCREGMLYGSETWVLTSSMLKVLEGFHNPVARRIAGKMPYYVTAEDRWVYPPTREALEIAGLYPIQAYLDTRRNRLADYVATRSIRQLYQEVEQPIGGPPNR
jgi:hypothetical protein